MEYYTEEISVLPYNVIRESLGLELPVVLAVPMALYFRTRGIFGLKSKAYWATGSVGSGKMVDDSQIPSAAKYQWGSYVEQLIDLGFEISGCYESKVLGEKQEFVLFLHDAQHKTLAQITWNSFLSGDLQTQTTQVEMVSLTFDEFMFLTLSLSKGNYVLGKIVQIESAKTQYFRDNVPLSKIYEAHQAACKGRELKRLSSEHNLTIAARHFDWMLKRGLIRPLTNKEFKRLSSQSANNS